MTESPDRWPSSRQSYRQGEAVGDARVVVRCEGRRVLLVVQEGGADVVVTIRGARYLCEGDRLIPEGLKTAWGESLADTGVTIECPRHESHRVDGGRLRAELDAWRGKTINLDLRRVASVAGGHPE